MTIGKRLRRNIIKSVKEELGALAKRSTPQAIKAADKDIPAALLRRHGKKAADIFITVIRADSEVCAATVRFEGPIGGLGDREYVRLHNRGGVWEEVAGIGLYTTFLSGLPHAS